MINYAHRGASEYAPENTLSLIQEFGVLEKTTFTSFNFDFIKRIKALNPKARVGLLTFNSDDETIDKLLSIGGEEFGPEARTLTDAFVSKLRSKGLGVRAWGVGNVELMKKMCLLKVDGMTLNFPDRLSQYLKNYKFFGRTP